MTAVNKIKELFEQAIKDEKSVSFDYSGKNRIAKPKEFVNNNQILVLQTGGSTSKGIIDTPSIKRFALEKIENFEIITEDVWKKVK